MEIEAQMRKYILENFMYSDDQSRLTSELSLIDNGIVDSTGVLELVGFIEETFGFKVDDADLVPDNFDSLAKMTAYIERKRPGA
jgi:acyl carrier protein